MIKKTYKLVKVDYTDSGYFYIKNVSNEVGEFSMNKKNNPSNSKYNTEYSTDGVNWFYYDFVNLTKIKVKPNTNLYLRGTKWGSGDYKYYTLNFDKNYIVCGNLLSIVDYVNMNTITTIVGTPDTSFLNYLFNNQTNLISAVDLNLGNVTSIGDKGILYLFNGCTSLTTPPDLSNITSVGNSGLNSTFTGCSSLTTAPDLSNVTSVGNNGLMSTFTGCSSLTTAPDLSNVTSVGTNGLESAYKLCTNLSTVTAPNISDLTQNNVLNNWLQSAGGQATGTKVVNVPTGATITTNSTSGIPTGWTRVDY